MANFNTCVNCPIPSTPFDPMLCMRCAKRYCIMFPRGCGQNCQGCRAKVAYQSKHCVPYSSTNIPTKPHWKCGKFHPFNTTCPVVTQFLGQQIYMKIPTHPHGKCGNFHPYGTQCPNMF